MSQTAVAKVEAAPLKNRVTIAANDPYKVRWGFNGTVREKFLNAREVGIPILPYAKWFPIQSFDTVQEFHTTDETQPKEMAVTIPAFKAETELLRDLGGQNETIFVRDLGLKIGFYEDEDTAKIAIINETLPTLSRIREICKQNKWENPIGEYCPSEDELDRDGRETCPTCWLKWLTSQAYANYCNQIAKNGMTVKVWNAGIGGFQESLYKPAISDLETAAKLMVDSIQTGLISLQSTWDEIVTEVEDEKGSQKNISTYQHGIRKDIHAVKPADRQAVMVQRSAEAFANANRSDNSDLKEVIVQMAENQKQMAENQNITNQAILQLLQERKGK